MSGLTATHLYLFTIMAIGYDLLAIGYDLLAIGYDLLSTMSSHQGIT